jgi:hypothetical protein
MISENSKQENTIKIISLKVILLERGLFIHITGANRSKSVSSFGNSPKRRGM